MDKKTSMVNKIMSKLPEKRLDKIFEKAMQKSKNVDVQVAKKNWDSFDVEQKRSYCIQAWNKAKKEDPKKTQDVENAMTKKVESEIEKVSGSKLSESMNILDESFKSVMSYVLMGVGIFASLLAFLYGIANFWIALALLAASAVATTVSRAIAEESIGEIVDGMGLIEEYFKDKYGLCLSEDFADIGIDVKNFKYSGLN